MAPFFKCFVIYSSRFPLEYFNAVKSNADYRLSPSTCSKPIPVNRLLRSLPAWFRDGLAGPVDRAALEGLSEGASRGDAMEQGRALGLPGSQGPWLSNETTPSVAGRVLSEPARLRVGLPRRPLRADDAGSGL